MPFPKLIDDGRTVQLDLHGATVDEAEDLVRKCVRLAADRGRDKVRVIHGSSTTRRDPSATTIKTRLSKMLSDGSLQPDVTDWVGFEDSTLVSLDSSRDYDRSTIRILDIT